MKKITIYIEENIPEDMIHPFTPQLAATDFQNRYEQSVFREGVKAGLDTRDLLQVIEFVNITDTCDCGDSCDCGNDCSCNNDDKCDDECKCEDKKPKSDKSSKRSKKPEFGEAQLGTLKKQAETNNLNA